MPYSNFANSSQERTKAYHNRKASDFTQNNMNNNESFTKMYEMRSRLLQSEQKAKRNNYYLNFRNSQETCLPAKLSKINSKEHMKSKIEIGGKDLHNPKHSIFTTQKPTISIEKFKLNIKHGVKTRRKFSEGKIYGK